MAIGFSACVDDFEPTYPDLKGKTGLRFSADTVIFDTVFTSLGSVTKRFRIYNERKETVHIDRIYLGRSSDSPYEVIINGRQGPDLQNIRLLGKDSMLVLVKVTIDPMDEDLPFLVKDSLLIEKGGESDNVKLLAWGQDAVFLKNADHPCTDRWTADRPYVITEKYLVEEGCSLEIEPGAKIYFNKGAALYIAGTLKVNGDADHRVLFQNDRLDERFSNALGQWQGIYFLEGSKGNIIEFADIRNAVNGLRIGTPDEDADLDVTVGHTRIENMSNTGILAFTSDLYVYNTLVNNCAVNAVGNFLGGNYTYRNCTFACFSFDFFRENPVMLLSDNILSDDGSVMAEDLNVVMSNTIVYGGLSEELLLSSSEKVDFNLSVDHSILRTENTALGINGNLINEDPQFTDPENYDYSLTVGSPAKDKGGDLGIRKDLMGKDRDSIPDIGAFEYSGD